MTKIIERFDQRDVTPDYFYRFATRLKDSQHTVIQSSEALMPVAARHKNKEI
jgi:hypothetical protein